MVVVGGGYAHLQGGGEHDTGELIGKVSLVRTGKQLPMSRPKRSASVGTDDCMMPANTVST